MKIALNGGFYLLCTRKRNEFLPIAMILGNIGKWKNEV